MKPTFLRRFRRHSSSSKEGAFFKKEGQEQSFFNERASHENFFQPVGTGTRPAVQRKGESEKEEKQLQPAVGQPKEEDKKLMRAEETKKEELKRAPEERDDKLQKKAGEAPGGITAPLTSGYVSQLSGKGQSLSKQEQSFFGQRMGVDFSRVKIHTGREAAQSAKEVNAKAYTVGDNIVFNEGQYNPQTLEGKKLLAHELTHVVQQQEQKKGTEGEIQRAIHHGNPVWRNVTALPYSDSARLGRGAWYTDPFRRPPSGSVTITVSTNNVEEGCHRDNGFGVSVYQNYLVGQGEIGGQHREVLGGTIFYSINLPTAGLLTYNEFSVRIYVTCETDVTVNVT